MENENILLTAKQYLTCEQKRAEHVNAARGVPLMRGFIGLQITGLLSVGVFEASLFFEIYGSLKTSEDASLTANMLGMGSLITLLAAHIVAKEYKESVPVDIFKKTVCILLLVFIFGAGSMISAEIMEGLADKLTPKGEGENEFEATATIPFLLGLYQNNILPNLGVLLPIGMTGLTAFCVFIATTLAEWIENNLKAINELGGNAKAANAFMKKIRRYQVEYALVATNIIQLMTQLKKVDKETINKAMGIIEDEKNILENTIFQMELMPSADPLENNHFQELFEETHNNLGNEDALIILRKKLDDLKALDEDKILAVLRA